MIIPTLHITNSESWIELIDLTNPNDKPISEISMATTEDTVAMWYDLLTTCMYNYDIGYDIGYMTAYDEMDEEDFES